MIVPFWQPLITQAMDEGIRYPIDKGDQFEPNHLTASKLSFNVQTQAVPLSFQEKQLSILVLFNPVHLGHC